FLWVSQWFRANSGSLSPIERSIAAESCANTGSAKPSWIKAAASQIFRIEKPRPSNPGWGAMLAFRARLRKKLCSGSFAARRICRHSVRGGDQAGFGIENRGRRRLGHAREQRHIGIFHHAGVVDDEQRAIV